MTNALEIDILSAAESNDGRALRELVESVCADLDSRCHIRSSDRVAQKPAVKIGDRLIEPEEGSDGLERWQIEAAVLRALKPKGVLFLCVANSARSQLAEGIARHLAPPSVRVQSAGSRPARVRPEAREVLGERGIDITSHDSKLVDEIDPKTVDTVVTLCAEEVCPVFLHRARRVHWGLPDPAAETDPGARMDAFRKTRDELERRLGALLGQTSPLQKANG